MSAYKLKCNTCKGNFNCETEYGFNSNRICNPDDDTYPIECDGCSYNSWNRDVRSSTTRGKGKSQYMKGYQTYKQTLTDAQELAEFKAFLDKDVIQEGAW